ncbi:MAG: hypothetical protein IT379_24730 [Deltaproteobacteria bacterium]|nr:hypothetical protein [Deltaproteobacteria bacterium]
MLPCDDSTVGPAPRERSDRGSKDPIACFDELGANGSFVRVAALIATLVALAGCYDTKRCAEDAVEVCDYEDNDCDGLVDEGFTDDDGHYATATSCGACNVVCSEAFPTAAETACGPATADPPSRDASVRDATPGGRDADPAEGGPRDGGGDAGGRDGGGDTDAGGRDGGAAARDGAPPTPSGVDPESMRYACRIVRCAEGEHLAGDPAGRGAGACVPDTPVLCLPCETDDDCAVREPGARCLATESGATRCGRSCVLSASDCPAGYTCTPSGADAQCVPSTGLCGCTDVMDGVLLGCLVESPTGELCAGQQECSEGIAGECRPALEEVCNDRDEDCDGEVDEDYRNERGQYVDRRHCGACGVPCSAPGPNMVATCLAEGDVVRCDVRCADGFVDVDRIAASGCECELAPVGGPPVRAGGDANCDGILDDVTDFVFVTTAGNDADPGTLARPMRTVSAAVRRGRDEGKSVLVARGVYDERVELVGGVGVFGGYSPTFDDRDLELYPTWIEHTSGAPGHPSLVCRGIVEPTRVDGFTIIGTDALEAGGASTAVLFDGCNGNVALTDVVVLAGRGLAGRDGRASSDVLADRGLTLEALDGGGGSPGGDGNEPGRTCGATGGAAGRHACPSGTDVSGGGGGAAECIETGCNQVAPCANAGCEDFTVGGVCDFEAVVRLAIPNPLPGEGRGPSGGDPGIATYNSPTDRGVCNFCDDNATLPREGGNGGEGRRGDDGAGGLGCTAAARFDVTTGLLSGGAGTDGSVGLDGSGGGGGSAGAGYDVIDDTFGGCVDQSGGGGGGGGAGGCGAPGATAGTGGGASVGIVVRLAGGGGDGPVLTRVRIVTASGGAGGAGGIGAAGGTAGAGAAGGGGRHWCARGGGRGGDGGRGGAGGGGGGGCGAGSHGVVVIGRGAEPYADAVRESAEIELAGVAGLAGPGGESPGDRGTSGLAGSAEPVVVIAE